MLYGLGIPNGLRLCGWVASVATVKNFETVFAWKPVGNGESKQLPDSGFFREASKSKRKCR
jgi:hypothetical protein